jgi:hypothetical protein
MAKGWREQQVIEQLCRLYKGHILADRYLAGEVMSKAEWAALSELIEKWRLRLYDIIWFMRCMNEYVRIHLREREKRKPKMGSILNSMTICAWWIGQVELFERIRKARYPVTLRQSWRESD